MSITLPINSNHLNQAYWDAQYEANTTGWDLGTVSPPIKSYIDTITNKDLKILVPGCGNGYEVAYLLEKGFTNITVIDIAPTLVLALKNKFANNTSINIVLGDFFKHEGQYDLIIEQTFFCALPPALREHYVFKMHTLLAQNGLLVGLLFNRNFDKNPPFGGSKTEYEKLFKESFQVLTCDIALNSIAPRASSELWIEFRKNSEVTVNLYAVTGITCSGCKADITNKIAILSHVYNVSINTDFTNLLIVGSENIDLPLIENTIATQEKRYLLTQIPN